MNYTHTPTGLKCRIIRREGDRAFCNFGAVTNPFCWVPYYTLREEPTMTTAEWTAARRERPDFDIYGIRRLFVQSIMPDREVAARITSMGNDDESDPYSGYCLDASSFVPTGCITRNRTARPVIDIKTRAGDL